MEDEVKMLWPMASWWFLNQDLADCSPSPLISVWYRITAAQPSPKLAAGREPARPLTGQIMWPECLFVRMENEAVRNSRARSLP